MKKIKIRTSKPYNIYFDVNLLDDIKPILAKISPSSIIIIYDNKLHITATKLNHQLCQTYATKIISLEVFEEMKNLDTATSLMNQILGYKIDKSTLIIGLGGGVIGDLVGFISSILLRGLKYIHIPSTLLAMVDSSIGGKCGVNTSVGKNLVGNIYQPLCVLMDYSLLDTLDNKNYLSGYGEIIKYALAFDSKFLNYLSHNLELLHGKHKQYLDNIIQESCKFKQYIVEKDEFETKDIRVLLNLGHSFGHALEKYNNYQHSLLHGEAVAIGCILALKFSDYMGFYKGKKEDIDTIINHIQKAHLQTSLKNIIDNIKVSKLIALMITDKKNTHKQINLILPQKIGKAKFIKNVNINQLTTFLQKELN